jgi:hypothetical protein
MTSAMRLHGYAPYTGATRFSTSNFAVSFRACPAWFLRCYAAIWDDDETSFPD